MVMTRDAVLEHTDALAHEFAASFSPRSRPWTWVVAGWARAQPIQAQATLRAAYWRQTHGQRAGTVPLSPELIAMLTAAERVWRQNEPEREQLAS